MTESWLDGHSALISSRSHKSSASIVKSDPVPTSGRVLATKKRALFWTPFWAAVAALMPIERFVLSDPGLATRVDRVILGALVVSLLFTRVAKPAFPVVWGAALVVIPFAGYASGHSSSVGASLKIAIPLAIMCALAPPVFRYHVVRTRNFVPWVVSAFVASQTFSALLGLAQLAGATPFGAGLIFGRSTGISGHPNVLGFMSAIVILICLSILRRLGPRLRLVIATVLVINVVALIATGSLSSMLACLVGILVLLIAAKRAVMVLIVAVVGGGALWVSVLFLGVDNVGILSSVAYRVSVVTASSSTDGGAASLGTRLETYKWALNYLSRDPIIGVGMDDRNSGTFDGITVVHDFILHAWYQGGLALFVWIVAMTICLIVGIVKSVRGNRSLGAVTVMSVILAFAATSAFFDQQQYWLPLLLSLALLPASSPVQDPDLRKYKSVRQRELARWSTTS